MTELFLDAVPRTAHGKSPVRKLRREGQVPGVVYGLGEPVSIQFDALQASKLVGHMHGGERLVSLRFGEGNGKARQVLLREVQTTPTGNHLLHIDFQEIDTSKKVHVTVEVRPVGTPVGVRHGGILQAVKHDIVIECLPTAIPEFINAEVGELEIGASLHVKDIVFPEGIAPVTDADETIIVISAPRVEVEEEEEAAVEEEGIEGAEEAAEEAPAEEAESE